MNNRATLNLKYVIWGQKIWNPSQDSVMPWSQWRDMEDRGSITANHWFVLHPMLRMREIDGNQGSCPCQLQRLSRLSQEKAGCKELGS